MTSIWRNKSYHKRRFNKSVVQVKENIPEGSAKRPTLWMITQAKDH